MNNDPPSAPKRMYTFVCVFYGNHNELIEFLKHTKHHFFIYHDKDDTDSHYHIYCTFSTNKSFNAVRNLMQSKSNMLVQCPLGTPIDNRDYFLHFPEEKYPDKHHYSPEAISYDSPAYWSKVFCDDSLPNEKNIEFITDLLKPTMRIEEMASKYGRDFIKNLDKYIFFRSAVLHERSIDQKTSEKGFPAFNIYTKSYIE